MVVLPLVWDYFSLNVFVLANTSHLAGFAGTLDGAGRATAHLNTFGPLPPTAVGLQMYFAGLLYEPFDFVTNPIAIAIEP